jgi:hypothetical protein
VDRSINGPRAANKSRASRKANPYWPQEGTTTPVLVAWQDDRPPPKSVKPGIGIKLP